MALFPPVAFLLLFASAASAEPPRPGELATRLAPTDSLGRRVPVPVPGRATLISFASPSNGEAVGAIAREIRVEHPELEVVSFIDVSSYPRLAHGWLQRAILKRQAGAVAETHAAFARAGKTAPPDLSERTFVIPDFEADAFARYDATDTDERPLMVLIGADAVVKAVFEARSLDVVRDAVGRALSGDGRAVAAAPPATATIVAD
jgi:hypothetical protein